MPILLKTRVKRTAKTLIPARRARVGGLCGFPDTAERVPARSPKTGCCTDVRERCGNSKRRKKPPAGGFRRRKKPQAARQPAMDLSRDKNAEKMNSSRLGMGAAMQAHGA